MPSFNVLEAVTYDVATKLCRAGTDSWCRFHGIRASRGKGEVPKFDELKNEIQRRLHKSISGSACVCVKGNPDLKEEAERSRNTREYCSGPPDFQEIT